MNQGLRKLNLTGMAMLMFPIIMIKMLALMMGVGLPLVANATSRKNPSPLILPNSASSGMQGMTEVHRLATRHIESMEAESFSINPMLYGSRVVTFSITTPSITQTYKLQMIMSTSSGRIALINNETYKVGDRFGNTPWRIVSIDGENRLVTAKHDETNVETVLLVD